MGGQVPAVARISRLRLLGVPPTPQDLADFDGWLQRIRAEGVEVLEVNREEKWVMLLDQTFTKG